MTTDRPSTATHGAGREPAGRLGRLAVALAMVSSVLLMVVLAAQLHRVTAGLRPGRQAPAFALTTFDGESLDLGSLRGRVVVLNFWASWCVSCVAEAQELERLWREYGPRGVSVVGVAYNDTRPEARAYLERYGVTYPCGMDPGGRISAAYRLTGVPETVLIDAGGRIAALRLRDGRGPQGKFVGPLTEGGAFTPEDLRQALDRLLAEGER